MRGESRMCVCVVGWRKYETSMYGNRAKKATFAEVDGKIVSVVSHFCRSILRLSVVVRGAIRIV